MTSTRRKFEVLRREPHGIDEFELDTVEADFCDVVNGCLVFRNALTLVRAFNRGEWSSVQDLGPAKAEA